MLILLICTKIVLLISSVASNGVELLPQKCPGTAEKGPCNRKFHKWYYDSEKQFCNVFIWGGCAGNDKNRFDTESQCMQRCAPDYKSKFLFNWLNAFLCNWCQND